MGRLRNLKPDIVVFQTNVRQSVAVERQTGRALQKIIKRIAARVEYICQACDQVDAYGEVDHIVPLYMMGQENDNNRQWLCRACHRVKSEREEANRRGRRD